MGPARQCPPGPPGPPSRLGRDHIASTVYTIVFAYAGAALPLLLLFQVAAQPFGTVITGSALGEELIRILVGASPWSSRCR